MKRDRLTDRLYLVAGKVTDSVTQGFLPAATALGLEVVILTDRPADHRRACDAEVVECDVTDYRSIVDRMPCRGPAAVFSNSDHLQAPTALAAAYHGLPGKDWRAATRTKNKALMRRHLAARGLDTVACAQLPAASGHGAAQSPADAPAHSPAFSGASLVAAVSAALPAGRPLVVKPRDGVASEDVQLVRDIAGLPAAVARIQARRSDPLVVEEFLPGRLHTLETLGDGRRLCVLGSFRTTLSRPPYFVEERLDWVPPPPESEQVLAQLAALGVGFGACHTEFVVHEGRARLIEVNYRAIGDHCDLLLADLLELPLFEYILRVHRGEALSDLPGLEHFGATAGGAAHTVDGTATGPAAGAALVPPPRRTRHTRRTAIVEYVVADRSGRLTERAPGAEDLVRGGVSLAFRPQRTAGEHIELTHTNRDYLGTIRAVGPDTAAIEREIRAFRTSHSWEIG